MYKSPNYCQSQQTPASNTFRLEVSTHLISLILVFYNTSYRITSSAVFTSHLTAIDIYQTHYNHVTQATSYKFQVIRCAHTRISINRVQAYTVRISTLSSASNGRWRRISSGSVSAAITTNSEIPLLRVLVAEDQ
jgi:hypothetical protein